MPSEPSDAAKRKAEEILDWLFTGDAPFALDTSPDSLTFAYAGSIYHNAHHAFCRTLAAKIALALHIKPGFIRDSEGVDHKGKWDHVDVSVYRTVLAFIPDDQEAAQQSASERGGGGC